MRIVLLVLLLPALFIGGVAGALWLSADHDHQLVEYVANQFHDNDVEDDLSEALEWYSHTDHAQALREDREHVWLTINENLPLLETAQTEQWIGGSK